MPEGHFTGTSAALAVSTMQAPNNAMLSINANLFLTSEKTRQRLAVIRFLFVAFQNSKPPNSCNSADQSVSGHHPRHARGGRRSAHKRFHRASLERNDLSGGGPHRLQLADRSWANRSRTQTWRRS